jgi:hypothetical protein
MTRNSLPTDSAATGRLRFSGTTLLAQKALA